MARVRPSGGTIAITWRSAPGHAWAIPVDRASSGLLRQDGSRTGHCRCQRSRRRRQGWTPCRTERRIREPSGGFPRTVGQRRLVWRWRTVGVRGGSRGASAAAERRISRGIRAVWSIEGLQALPSTCWPPPAELLVSLTTKRSCSGRARGGRHGCEASDRLHAGQQGGASGIGCWARSAPNGDQWRGWLTRLVSEVDRGRGLQRQEPPPAWDRRGAHGAA